MAQQSVKDERSIGELFSELIGETGTLIKHEVALVQTELTQKATKAGANIGLIAIGGVLGLAGLLSILASIIIIIANFIPLWLSALLTGIILAIISGIIIMKGLNSLKETTLVPQQTVETLKEDAKWLKEQV